jgi:hypothetical protein
MRQIGMVSGQFHLVPSESVGLLGAWREFVLHGEDLGPSG